METTSALHNDMKLCMFPAVSPCSGDLEMMVARRDSEILHLREEVRRLQHLLQEIQERTANHITLLQQQLTNKSQDIEILQAKLQSQQDYVKIKAEISSPQWLKQTSVNPHTVLVSSPPPDVSSVSVRQSASLYLQPTDPAVKREMKTPVQSQLELLNEAPVISDLPVINRRSPSLKEENDITHPTSDPCRRAEECFLSPSVSIEAVLHNTECDDNMDQDEPQFNTTRITQQVKEVLQTYKIGQRVFAHYVLGLSQGTVSEILARPKPWSKLTTRGREPFMRMRHFLSDEHSIQTLSIIQHGRRGIIPCSPPPDTSSDNLIRNILEQSQLELAEHDRRPPGEGDASENIIRNILQQAKHEMQLPSHVTSKMCSNSMVKSEEVDSGRLNPSSLSPTDFVQSIIREVQSETDGDTHSSINPLDSWCPACSSIDRSSSQRSLQTLPVGSDLSKQEFLNTMAPEQLSKEKVTTEEVLRCGLDQLAVKSCRINQRQDQDESLISDCPTGINTSYLDIQQPAFHSLELDTLSITKRVKEILTVNNIGQRVFGEAVLGLTQSSVSELLSHPKPWTKLSVKGQENFIHLNLWLLDPHNVQKLKALKTIRQKAHLKRSLIRPDIDSQDTTGSEFVGSGLFVPKRQRVVLTSQKKEALKRVYDREPYPSQHTILTLASQLGLQISTVSNWFYNYRSRGRQDTSGGGRAAPHGPVHTIQSPTSFSPVSDSSPTRLIAIKQEPTDAEMEDAGLQRDEEHNNYVSVCVQSDMRVKQEEANGLRSPGSCVGAVW